MFTVDNSRRPATPCLVVDGASVRANIARHGGVLPRAPPQSSPAHQDAQVALRRAVAARRRRDAGLTVAKAGEAEVMAEVCDDVLIAYPTVDRAAHALDRPSWPPQRTVRVGIDSREAADALSAAAAGQRSRHSASSSISTLASAARACRRAEDAQQSRPRGHATARLAARRRDVLSRTHRRLAGAAAAAHRRQSRARLGEVLDLWRRDGLEAKIVSGGSTPTALQSHHFKVLDRNPLGHVCVQRRQRAVRAATPRSTTAPRASSGTVVSTAVPGKVILDGGTQDLHVRSLRPEARERARVYRRISRRPRSSA